MDSIKKKLNKMKPSTSSESSDSDIKKTNGKLISSQCAITNYCTN